MCFWLMICSNVASQLGAVLLRLFFENCWLFSTRGSFHRRVRRPQRPSVATTSAAWFVALWAQVTGEGRNVVRRPSNSRIVVSDNSWRGRCGLLVEDLRASSVSIQHVTGCSREAEQERWRGGWREITCWSHKSRQRGLPLEQQSRLPCWHHRSFDALSICRVRSLKE